MSDSGNSSSVLIGGNPYKLLKFYGTEAKIKSKAYGYSEAYYRWLAKALSYPIIVISAVSSVLAGLDEFDQYILMCLSLSTLILVGFTTAISPKDKEQKAAQHKVEFGEIDANIRQFILENNKSHEEIKTFSEIVHSEMNVWNSLAPAIQDRFMERATRECTARTRATCKHKNYGSTHPDQRSNEKKI